MLKSFFNIHAITWYINITGKIKQGAQTILIKQNLDFLNY